MPELRIQTRGGETTMLASREIERLASMLRGDVAVAGTPPYEENPAWSAAASMGADQAANAAAAAQAAAQPPAPAPAPATPAADASAAQPTSASVTSTPGNSIVGDYHIDFDALDKNHDGSISRSEAKSNKELSREFKAVDMNHNGKLSKDELKGWM